MTIEEDFRNGVKPRTPDRSWRARQDAEYEVLADAAMLAEALEEVNREPDPSGNPRI